PEQQQFASRGPMEPCYPTIAIRQRLHHAPARRLRHADLTTFGRKSHECSVVRHPNMTGNLDAGKRSNQGRFSIPPQARHSIVNYDQWGLLIRVGIVFHAVQSRIQLARTVSREIRNFIVRRVRCRRMTPVITPRTDPAVTITSDYDFIAAADTPGALAQPGD